MNDDKRYLLKVLSVLLQYPNEELMLNFEEIGEAVEKIARINARERCTNFLKYLEETPLIRLQEAYTATFDFNPATCLNLTYHKWGDARERGKALISFHQLYKTAGYESTSGELPDYLPLLLEFLYINSQECDFSFLGQYCDQLEAVSSRLREKGSPYTGLFEIVMDIFRDLRANGA